MLPFALMLGGGALGAASWLTNATGKVAVGLLLAEAFSFLLLLSGG